MAAHKVDTIVQNLVLSAEEIFLGLSIEFVITKPNDMLTELLVAFTLEHLSQHS